MDLYDDLDTKQRAGQIDGWSSGIKMLQTQLAIKKATLPPPRRDPPKKATMLTPVINLKAKRDTSDIDGEQFSHNSSNISGTASNSNNFKATLGNITTITKHKSRPEITSTKVKIQTTTITPALQPLSSNKNHDYDLEVIDEYDPLWPNEYEKLVKEKRDKENDKRESRKEERERKRRHNRFVGGNAAAANNNNNSSGAGSNISEDSPPPAKYSGFGSRATEEDSYSPPASSSSGGQTRASGAAIAPPPSLQDESQNSNNSNDASIVTIPYGANSVAAKIMAKYGFKDGQGLGKLEQGMSMALQVEKTSKRGGRIIHEKELIMPPPPPAGSSPSIQLPALSLSPQPVAAVQDIGSKSVPSITEIMKSPSKVVLLRNMVGPGDVDNELEPEVKDECNTKYGEVISVVIHEIADVVPEDAVRIFVEFKRIESAIKAVVDVNGRFFGGREVRAGFYNFDRYKNLQLTD